MDIGNSGTERTTHGTPDSILLDHKHVLERVAKGNVIKNLILLPQTFLPSHLMSLHKILHICAMTKDKQNDGDCKQDS